MAPKRSKQTQLSFTPGEDLSFTSSQQRISPPPPTTRQQPRREAYVNKKKPPADEDIVYDTGESVSEDEGAVDRLQLAKEVATGRAQDSDDDDEEEEEEEPEQEVQKARKRKNRALVISISDDDEQPVASTSKRQPAMNLNDKDWGSPLSETEFSSPVKPSSSAAARPSPSPQTVAVSPVKKKAKTNTFEGVFIDHPSPRRSQSKSASPAVSVGVGAKGKGKEKEQKQEKRKSKLSSMLLDDEASEASEEEEEHRFAPKVTGEGGKRRAVVHSSEEEEEEQPRKPIKKKAETKGKGKAKAPAAITLDDSSDSEAPSQPTRRRKPSTTSKKRAHSSSPMPPAPPLPRSSPSKKRKILTASQRRRARDDTPPESGSEDDGSDSEDGWLVKDTGRMGEKDRKSKSKGKGKEKEKAADKPKSKKLKRRRNSPTPPIASDEESSDFTDDDDLSLSGKETLQENRLRTIKSPGAKNGGKFEMLRRLRAEKESEKQLAADRARRRIVDSDDEDNDAGSSASSQPTSTAHKKKRALTASYLGAEVLSFSSSESGSDGESEQISDGGRGGRRKATNWERESDLDRDEEGFIVDEDEDEEGMKVVNEYREKVTVKAQGMMYFLKTYLQFLVHLIVCPQVDWLADDSAFKAAYDAINDNLKGLTQSLIGSAAWKAPFKKALDERPVFHLFDLDGIDRAAPCDACTMGKSRHSIYSGSLSGPYYDRKTYTRPVLDSNSDSSSDEDDSDEDSDSDASAISARKRETEKQRKEKMDAMDNTHQDFNLGSSCAGRAQVYHELHHWGFTTHERLQEQMTKLKIQKQFPKVDGLNRMSVKDRKKAIRQVVERQRKEADRCAARMDEEGVIVRFAKKLEDEIQKARQAFATNKS